MSKSFAYLVVDGKRYPIRNFMVPRTTQFPPEFAAALDTAGGYIGCFYDALLQIEDVCKEALTDDQRVTKIRNIIERARQWRP